MVTDPGRARRSDPGDPDVCNLFPFHSLYSPAGGVRKSSTEECRTAARGCVDCKKHLIRNMNAALEPIRQRRAEIVAKNGLRPGRPRRREREARAIASRDDEQGRRDAMRLLYAMAEGIRIPVPPGAELVQPYPVKLPHVRGAARPPPPPHPEERGRPAEHPGRGHLPPVPRVPRPHAGARPRGRGRVPLRRGAPRPHQVAAGPAAGARRDGAPQEDPRDELVRRLLEYRKFKGVAETLHEMEAVRLGLWSRPPAKLETAEAGAEEADLSEVSLFDLLTRSSRGRSTATVRAHPPALEIEHQKFSIKEKMEEMLARVRSGAGPVPAVGRLQRPSPGARRRSRSSSPSSSSCGCASSGRSRPRSSREILPRGDRRGGLARGLSRRSTGRSERRRRGRRDTGPRRSRRRRASPSSRRSSSPRASPSPSSGSRRPPSCKESEVEAALDVIERRCDVGRPRRAPRPRRGGRRASSRGTSSTCRSARLLGLEGRNEALDGEPRDARDHRVPAARHGARDRGAARRELRVVDADAPRQEAHHDGRPQGGRRNARSSTRRRRSSSSTSASTTSRTFRSPRSSRRSTASRRAARPGQSELFPDGGASAGGAGDRERWRLNDSRSSSRPPGSRRGGRPRQMILEGRVTVNGHESSPSSGRRPTSTKDHVKVDGKLLRIRARTAVRPPEQAARPRRDARRSAGRPTVFALLREPRRRARRRRGTPRRRVGGPPAPDGRRRRSSRS